MQIFRMMKYKIWLKAHEIEYEEVPSGLIFQYKIGTFILSVDYKDKQFLSLHLPNVWKIEPGAELTVLKVANEINCDLKVVKAVIKEDMVSLRVEIFLDNDPNIDDFMERILDLLLQAALSFNIGMIRDSKVV